MINKYLHKIASEEQDLKDAKRFEGIEEDEIKNYENAKKRTDNPYLKSALDQVIPQEYEHAEKFRQAAEQTREHQKVALKLTLYTCAQGSGEKKWVKEGETPPHGFIPAGPVTYKRKNKYLAKAASEVDAGSSVADTNQNVNSARGFKGGNMLQGIDNRNPPTSMRNRILEPNRESDPDTPVNEGSAFTPWAVGQ